MQNITFHFRADVKAAQREAVLDRLRGIPGVLRAELLRPNAKSSAVQRLGYIQLQNEAEEEKALREINDFAEIESAAVPPDRYLQSE